MKPISMKEWEVRALLANRKSVTRRVVKPQPLWRKPPIQQEGHIGYWATWDDEKIYKSPYFPGEILYVRETWAKIYYVDPDGYTHYNQPMIYYAADGEPDITLVDDNGFEKDDQRVRWRPSIHMPREAARLFLRVTDVRVERLQDITEEQAIAEGFEQFPHEPATVGFVEEWNSTIKPADLPLYGWDANPWVWVIEFERISKEDIPPAELAR